MSDDELERLRRRRLTQLRKEMEKKRVVQEEASLNPEVLKKAFTGRGLEVFNATKAQYPKVAEKLGNMLTKLISSGKITHISGEELYTLLKKMGVNVKLNTKIWIREGGKLKSIREKMKE
jgi:DNA-binding TFAR19-related protein (PDSD5 family)